MFNYYTGLSNKNAMITSINDTYFYIFLILTMYLNMLKFNPNKCFWRPFWVIWLIDWLCAGNRWIIPSRTKTTGWWRISSRTAKTGQDVCTIRFKSIITGHVRRWLRGAMGADPPPLPLYWHHVNLPSALEFSSIWNWITRKM